MAAWPFPVLHIQQLVRHQELLGDHPRIDYIQAIIQAVVAQLRREMDEPSSDSRKILLPAKSWDEPYLSCHRLCAEQSDSCVDRSSVTPKHLGDPSRDAPARKYMPVHCSSKRPYLHMPGSDSIGRWRISSQL
ncbi:hypothetical protein TURU_034951 [Turdus rufiventris]|nr:hypothetical protein TURU_034951 [Turdus rufiventris]